MFTTLPDFAFYRKFIEQQGLKCPYNSVKRIFLTID